MKAREDVKLSWLWFLLVVVWCSAVSLHAGSVSRPNIDAGAPVDMEMDSWLKQCPTAGMAPMRWRVMNHSNEARTWQVNFSSGNNYELGSATISSYSITVPGGQAGEMMLHVPVGNANRGYYGAGPELNWLISGPWVQGGGNLDSVGYSSSRTEYIALSEGVAGTGGWNELKKALDTSSGSKDLAGSEVDMRKAPEDWRGYTGIGQLWITDKEWLALSELQRLALLDWVTFVGQVVMLAEDVSPERVAALKLPEASGDIQQHGAGELRVLKWDGKNFPTNDAAKLVLKDMPTLNEGLGDYNEAWKLLKRVGELTINTPLVFGFIVVFGLLVGPINLFWFAGARRRSRLFWTTPLLSIAGSLLLMGLMVVQDGFGGEGARTALVILQPEQKRMVVMQEQVSKTGILTSRGFAKQEPLMILPLRVEGSRHSVQINERYVDEMSQGSGAWFSSRAIQGQWLQTVRPTRAAVEWFAAKDLAVSSAPEVLSSVDVTLTKLFLMDEEGKLWTAENLGTGERKKLVEVKSDKEFQMFYDEVMSAELGPLMGDAMKALKDRRGFFYAVTDRAEGLMMETLPSIQWKRNRVVLVGPYVKQP